MAKPDWITLSKNSGSGNDTVDVTAQVNSTAYYRKGEVTVSSTNGSISKQVIVEQLGMPSFKINLHFVGVPKGSYYAVKSFYGVLTPLVFTNTNFSNAKIKIRVSDGGIIVDFPKPLGIDSSDFLEFPVVSSYAGQPAICQVTFSEPVIINTPNKLSFVGVIRAYEWEPSGYNENYLIGDKNQSTIAYEEEALMVDASTIPETAAGGTTSVTIGTQDSVEWTVE